MGCLAARLGITGDALNWLRQARDRGFDSLDLLAEPDLDSLRGHEELRRLARAVGAG
jgi:hypothetical protein